MIRLAVVALVVLALQLASRASPHLVGRNSVAVYYVSDPTLADVFDPFTDAADWLSYFFGIALAVTLLPGRPVDVSGRYRRLVLLSGAMIMLVFWLSDIGAQADIGLYGEPIPRSAPLRFPITALGVLLLQSSWPLSRLPTQVLRRRPPLGLGDMPQRRSAWTLSATAIGFAAVSNQGRLLALSSAVLALLAFIALCVVVLPERLVALRTRRLVAAAAETRTETLKAENDIRASLLQASSGIVLVAGVVFTFLQLVSAQETTHRQLELTLAGQTADRFTRAVDQLDADKAVDVQLGGIYSLGRIADETPDYHAAIRAP
jgi:hypothetical protein